MKKSYIFFAAIILAALNFQIAGANIWRVNNNATGAYGENFGGTATHPVFRQVNDAGNSNLVTAGDTVYVEGSQRSYGNDQTLKSLVIIGPGYFLNENEDVSNDGFSAVFDEFEFGSEANNSQLIGVEIADGTVGLLIEASNILIKRCKIDYKIDLTAGYEISNINIVENFFANAGNRTSSAIYITTYGLPSHVIFDNNICKSPLLLNYGGVTYILEECNNNVFDCLTSSNKLAIKLNANSFRNNILTNAKDTVSINNGSDAKIDYNISASNNKQFGTSKHNIIDSNMSKLFVSSNSSDGKYQLKPNSRGSNNGSDGTDRGAFGGSSLSKRYTLSGLPPIPVIYDLSTGDATPSTGLPVTISARTIK